MTSIQAKFVGSWQLIAQDSQYMDGRRIPSRGENPRGILVYDAYGNMAVQLMRTDADTARYTDLSRLETAMHGFHAYFGTYQIDESAQLVRHFVVGSGYAGYVRTTQERRYQFSDDRLVLSAPSPLDESVRVLIWRRLSEQMAL